MSIRISFNGADNVGKTTQINALHDYFGERSIVVPHITKFNPDWKQVPGDFQWYFDNSTHEAWLKLMLDSLYQRNQFIQTCTKEIILIDRGVKMFLMSIAAALKERMKLPSIQDANNLLANFIATNYGHISDLEDVLLLLKQSHQRSTNITTTIERCNFQDPQMKDTYTRYQEDLNTQLEGLASESNCHTIIVGPRSITEVSAEIRYKLRSVI